MKIEIHLKEQLQLAFRELYQEEIESPKLDKTRPEFEGDYTLVVFPYLRQSKTGPEQTAQNLGNWILNHSDWVSDFNVIKGFLNLVIADSYWTDFANEYLTDASQITHTADGKDTRIMVEYSSPNTNKPLHLGHIRNNLLGYSVSKILEHNGYEVIKANLINDRGIHICKSMLAWMKFGAGETPESSGLKGDHLVGKYYVAFDKAYKQEIDDLVASGKNKEEAEKQAPLLLEAQEMLRKWEAKDPETIRVWEMMNGWVYAGFEQTYRRMGVSFDQFYYESNTYLLGKDIVNEGLEKGILYQKEDGSVWIDLTSEKLDQKLLLRSDGTSVYMTQDLGTADLKFQEYQMPRSIYVVGNEQDYHFKVLFSILNKLERPYAEGLYHLSYGMVDLPSGKMKSREGTVVDADDLMDEMHQTADTITRELGKIEGLSEEELYSLFEKIGMGALKYFLLKVDPGKRILFDPKESIDFQGNTGPFLQYTFARINSLQSNAGDWSFGSYTGALEAQEKDLIRYLHDLPGTIRAAGKNYSPALIANYVYDLVKSYNRFYHDLPVLKEENAEKRNLRLMLSKATAEAISACFAMLGIPEVEKM
ncbi:MAG: arginine--tRNA ligase [Bacteroidetes bacterium]|nr:arginine--tRNA ligase [Bacteroidota bacterium]